MAEHRPRHGQRRGEPPALREQHGVPDRVNVAVHRPELSAPKAFLDPVPGGPEGQELGGGNHTKLGLGKANGLQPFRRGASSGHMPP
jgi:hypothetical protein